VATYIKRKGDPRKYVELRLRAGQKGINWCVVAKFCGYNLKAETRSTVLGTLV